VNRRDDDRKREDDAYGDAVYAAWRAGYDPDSVDRDRIRDDVHDGLDRFQCADAEVARQQARRDRIRMARIAEEAEYPFQEEQSCDEPTEEQPEQEGERP